MNRIVQFILVFNFCSLAVAQEQTQMPNRFLLRLTQSYNPIETYIAPDAFLLMRGTGLGMTFEVPLKKRGVFFASFDVSRFGSQKDELLQYFQRSKTSLEYSVYTKGWWLQSLNAGIGINFRKNSWDFGVGQGLGYAFVRSPELKVLVSQAKESMGYDFLLLREPKNIPMFLFSTSIQATKSFTRQYLRFEMKFDAFLDAGNGRANPDYIFTGTQSELFYNSGSKKWIFLPAISIGYGFGL